MILTRLPVGRIADTPPPLAKSVWAFPLVGAVVGLAMAIVFMLALTIGLPVLAAAFMALGMSVLTTGGLHEDGLADMADGFGGGATTARKLEIMRDSRIGSYGVIALIIVLGASASAIASGLSALAFVAIGAASRATMLLPMILLNPARDDGLGHGATVTLGPPVYVALALTGVALAAAGALIAGYVMLLIAVIIAILARRQIGGQTGDVLGATQKLTECAGLLTAAATIP